MKTPLTHRVKHGEEEGGAGHDLVEDDVGVEGDVLVESPFLHLCDQVSAIGQRLKSIALIDQSVRLAQQVRGQYLLMVSPADCEEKEAVAEWEGGGWTPGHGDTDTHHMSQVPENIGLLIK